MILNIEGDLSLIDTILGYTHHSLYHIGERNMIDHFGKITNGTGSVLHNLQQVLDSKSDILGLNSDLLLSANIVTPTTVSDLPFYSLTGFSIFKDFLEYKLYSLSVYKEYMFKEPITNDNTPYYPEYFNEITQFDNDVSVLRMIIRRHILTEIRMESFNKIVSIVSILINNIDFKIFSKRNVYRVSAPSYHIIIEDLGNVFELRYRDVLLTTKRIIS